MLNEIIKKQPIIAIDLGTTKFCAARISYDEGFQLQLHAVPAAGMHRGMLADFEQAAGAVNHLIESVEKKWGIDVQRVVTGIAGSHLFSEATTVCHTLHGEIVTNKHLELATDKAHARAQKRGQELLHLVGQRYRLDEREWMDNPLGFSCGSLTAEYLAIYCDETYLQDVIRLMNRSGVQVDEVYAEPFASATVSVNQLQRERGCVVADIGGGTTDGIVFQHGKPAALFTVNVAGTLMTKDLALGLRTDMDSAEKIKRRFGLNDIGSPVPINEIDGSNRMVSSEQVKPILAARVAELGSLLAQSLRSFKGAVPGGIILTGGGAQVAGIDQFLHQLLKVSVQKSLPVLPLDNDRVATDTNMNTPYATVIGLLNLEISRLCELRMKEHHFWPTRYLERFIHWIRELS